MVVVCVSHVGLLVPLSVSLVTSLVSRSAVLSTAAPANGSDERRQMSSIEKKHR